MFHHRPGQDRVERDAALVKEHLSGLAGVIGEAADGVFRRLAVEQAREVVSVAQRLVDRPLLVRVAPGVVAVDGMDGLRTISKEHQRHAEVVAGPEFGHRAAEAVELRVPEIVPVDPLDIVERLLQRHARMRGTGAGLEASRSEAATKQPVVEHGKRRRPVAVTRERASLQRRPQTSPS